MKLLYVITGLAQGGAERVVCDLAEKMYEKGNEVKIVYLIGEIVTFPIYKDIELIKVDLNNFISFMPAYIKLVKIIKTYQPDVVHSHMVHANLLSRLVRLVVPMSKLICTAHNSNEGGRTRMLLYRITNSLADTTTNVSKEATIAFEDMGAVPKNGMSTVYNGINLNKFRYSSSARIKLRKDLYFNDDYKIILAVGRFNEQKDYPNLLKAIQLLKNDIILPFKLVIAGDGELRPLLEHTINELGLERDVILVGRRNDVPELMSMADLFVLSSNYEGFGLVVAEAMACECLVVATDCGGVAEVLNNSEFLVPRANSEALKNKIKYALSLDENTKNNQISQNLQHVFSNFSLIKITEKWIDIYNER